MSDSRPALFQAVLDRPDDDAPRMAYAGYCDAQGDPYGAFIRAQLARTEALRRGSDEQATKYGDEARQLETKHRSAEWTHGIEKLVRHPSFIRGFVDKVIVDVEQYLAHSAELFRLAPLRQIVLSEVGDHIPAVARDPHLSQVVSLAIGNTSGNRPIGDAGLAALLSSPYLHNLKSLDLARQGITTAGLDALCASKALPSLIYVNLVGNSFEDPVETAGADWATGQIIAESIQLGAVGKQLEAKYGRLAWLHGPSLLRRFPPTEDEL